MKKLDFNYKTSKDYNKLFDLVQTQRVICIVTYTDKISDTKEIAIKDICASSALISESSINIGARGTGFITAMEFDGKTIKEDFIRQCEHYNLEYIEPNL